MDNYFDKTLTPQEDAFLALADEGPIHAADRATAAIAESLCDRGILEIGLKAGGDPQTPTDWRYTSTRLGHALTAGIQGPGDDVYPVAFRAKPVTDEFDRQHVQLTPADKQLPRVFIRLPPSVGYGEVEEIAAAINNAGGVVPRRYRLVADGNLPPMFGDR